MWANCTVTEYLLLLLLLLLIIIIIIKPKSVILNICRNSLILSEMYIRCLVSENIYSFENHLNCCEIRRVDNNDGDGDDDDNR